MDTRIVIVGGGAAGLSAAGALKRRGLNALVLDRDARVGDVWARRYDRLRLHTVYSSLAHFPLPRTGAKYPTRDEYAAYLRAYARHFALDVVAGCAVRRVAPAGESSAEWLVESDCGTWRARAVILATGQYSVPVLPTWPGQGEYAGQLLHSAEYHNARPFVGKRVLVVGIGNSGAEIAADLAENGAAHVAIAIRAQPPIVPRDAFGMPSQRTSFALSRLPPALADRMARATVRLTLGDLRRYGLRPAAWWPYGSQRVPVIDVGFAAALKRGLIATRSALEQFTRSGVVFADGRDEDFDAVIAATGFRSGLPEVLDLPGALDEHGYPRFPSGQPTAFPGLYFIGFTHSLLGHLYEANRDSRRLARVVEAYLQAEPRA